MTKEKMILYSSDEAAEVKTVTGWVARTGRFWRNDEHMARWDGCTHVECDCGAVIERGRVKCDLCRDRAALQRYMDRPRQKWNKEDPLYSETADVYFWCGEDLLEHCLEYDVKATALRLRICVPVYAKEIDPNEHYCDSLPEDGEVMGDLADMFEELNKFIRESKTILSWEPGDYAAEVD